VFSTRTRICFWSVSDLLLSNSACSSSVKLRRRLSFVLLVDCGLICSSMSRAWSRAVRSPSICWVFCAMERSSCSFSSRSASAWAMVAAFCRKVFWRSSSSASSVSCRESHISTSDSWVSPLTRSSWCNCARRYCDWTNCSSVCARSRWTRFTRL